MLSYIRASLAALKAHQTMLDTVANNVANINTSGYRRMRVEFSDVVYRQLQPVFEQPQTARVLSGGVLPEQIPRSFELGRFDVTGNPLDLALNGEGFFQTQLADGRVAYIRDGHFGADATGRLVTGGGQPVAPEITIPPDASRIYVYPNGGVFVQRGLQDRGTAWEQVGQLQIATFANPNGLAAIGANLFVETPASGPAQVGNPGDPLAGAANARLGEVLFATLETSNVDIATETTSVLMAQRAYGLNMRALQTIEEMLGMATNLRRG